jgi:Mg2+/citrate symporter
MGAFSSPFIVPLAVFAWLSITVIAKVMGDAQKRRVIAEQRMAMLQRGVPAEQIEVLLRPARNDREDDTRTKDPLRSLGNARRTAVVLVSMGLGVVVFGLLLSEILRLREVLTVAAAGLIPLAIGIGFFIDYNLQKRELSRFGLEVGAELPSDNRRA